MLSHRKEEHIKNKRVDMSNNTRIVHTTNHRQEEEGCADVNPLLTSRNGNHYSLPTQSTIHRLFTQSKAYLYQQQVSILYMLVPSALCLLVILLLLTGGSHPVNNKASTVAVSSSAPCCSYSPRLSVLAVGDSITQYATAADGWYQLLAQRYVRQADFINRGLAGYNTRTTKTLIQQHMQQHVWPMPQSSQSHSGYTQLLLIYLGTNDAALPNTSSSESKLHVPLSEYHDNLRDIILMLAPDYAGDTGKDIQHQSNVALLLLTPGQVNIEQWMKRWTDSGKPPAVTRSIASARQYADQVKKIGMEWHIPVIDLFNLLDATLPYWTDGLHLNAAGNRVVYDAIVATIAQHYPSLSSESLYLDAPLYKDIDYADLQKSFAAG